MKKLIKLAKALGIVLLGAALLAGALILMLKFTITFWAIVIVGFLTAAVYENI